MEYLQYYLMIGCLCGAHCLIGFLLSFLGFDFMIKECDRKKSRAMFSEVKNGTQIIPQWIDSLILSVIVVIGSASLVVIWPLYIYDYIRR